MTGLKERLRKLQSGCGVGREANSNSSSQMTSRKRREWELYRRMRDHEGMQTTLTTPLEGWSAGIPGAFYETEYGSVFYRDVWIDAEFQFPWYEFSQLPVQYLLPDLENPGMLDEWVFLDIETTGLAGGAGTIPFLVGIAWGDGAGLQVRQFFLRELDDEPALLEALREHLTHARGIITYNGKTFDVQVLSNRYRLNRMDWDILELPHIDIFHWVRRIWQNRLESLKLQDMEYHLFQTVRTFDLRSSEIPGAYRFFLRYGWHEMLARVFEHNVVDIKSLAGLTLAILRACILPTLSPLAERDTAILNWHIGRMWVKHDWRLSLELWKKILHEENTLPPRHASTCLVATLRLIRRKKVWYELPDILESIGSWPKTRLLPWAWNSAGYYAFHFLRDLNLTVHFLEHACTHPHAHRYPEKVRLWKRRLHKLKQGKFSPLLPSDTA